jgi:heat shock protein HtpX
MLLAALTGLIVGLAHIFGMTYGGGPEAGNSWALNALIVCGLMNFIMFWFSDKIVLKMYKARQIGPTDAPKLYNMVERLAQRNGMPMPNVYIVPTQSPNAFATGRSPSHASVAATEGIMKLLSDDELEGVMAHELAHVKNRDTLISTIAATLGGVVSYLARAMMFSGRRRGGNRGGGAMLALSLAAMILAPLVAAMIQMAVSRSREYVADATGARMCGNPDALARALERLQAGVTYSPMPESMGSPATSNMFIVNAFGAAGMMGKLFSTHPPIDERARRLREMRM